MVGARVRDGVRGIVIVWMAGRDVALRRRRGHLVARRAPAMVGADPWRQSAAITWVGRTRNDRLPLLLVKMFLRIKGDIGLVHDVLDGADTVGGDLASGVEDVRDADAEGERRICVL